MDQNLNNPTRHPAGRLPGAHRTWAQIEARSPAANKPSAPTPTEPAQAGALAGNAPARYNLKRRAAGAPRSGRRQGPPASRVGSVASPRWRCEAAGSLSLSPTRPSPRPASPVIAPRASPAAPSGACPGHQTDRKSTGGAMGPSGLPLDSECNLIFARQSQTLS
jgi:hypothetical protein